MLKCAGNDDAITMKADDAGDTVTFMFESPGAWRRARANERVLERDDTRTCSKRQTTDETTPFHA